MVICKVVYSQGLGMMSLSLKSCKNRNIFTEDIGKIYNGFFFPEHGVDYCIIMDEISRSDNVVLTSRFVAQRLGIYDERSNEITHSENE